MVIEKTPGMLESRNVLREFIPGILLYGGYVMIFVDKTQTNTTYCIQDDKLNKQTSS